MIEPASVSAQEERARTGHAGADAPVLLSIEDLKKYYGGGGMKLPFQAARTPLRAVDGVSFQVRRGQNFGLVGESGSGKSTLAKAVLRLEPLTAGRVRFDGADVFTLGGAALMAFRKATHIVFQDPNSSLSPRMRVGDIIAEPLVIQGVPGREVRRRLDEVLGLVGLSSATAQRFPHEFSGGQRQRIAIARAVIGEPKLIVLDEPVSALDVSIRAQILNLLRDLQERLDLTYLTIAHDLAVVYQACDVVGVMYLGKLVELAPSEDLFGEPLHPYTRILLSSIPIADPRQRNRERLPLRGEIPSPKAPPPGCTFHPRCPIAVERCATEIPDWREVRPGRWVACHLVESRPNPPTPFPAREGGVFG